MTAKSWNIRQISLLGRAQGWTIRQFSVEKWAKGWGATQETKPEETEDKYQERTSRWQELCENAHNTADIIIGKQRHGPIGTVELSFQSRYTSFGNLAK